MARGTGAARALVTGGAGLIGSHLADGLLREGYRVRILDNLEPQTHRGGKPSWVPEEAEFVRADVRDVEAVRAALDGVEVVFHQAAHGGYMPEMGKYAEANSLGTARLLETIRDENLPVEKVVGSGRATTSRRAAETVADALGQTIEPVARGGRRRGEMRRLAGGVSRIRAAGYTTQLDFETGTQRYPDWIATRGDARDYFATAEGVLREMHVFHRVAAAPGDVR